MSDQDNFLSRWARRKREVSEAEAKADVGAVAPTPASDAPAGPGEQPTPKRIETSAKPAESLFDPATLPPIESITAETDIRAFLAPGVPADLARAALRRAWSADPAIRDFIGLSENSWDFNDPGAMAGFGPIEMTDDLRRVIAQLLTPEPQARPDSGAIPQQELENSAPAASVEMSEGPREVAPRQDERAGIKEEFAARGRLSHGETNTAAVQQQPNEQIETSSTGRRCHGGALHK